MRTGMMALGIAAAVALLAAGLAAASPMWQRDTGLHEIIEEGTFAELQQYRDETGRPVMPWVDSEEEFAQMREHHEEMEAWHEENGVANSGMGGMMGGFGGMMGDYGGVMGRSTRGSSSGGCPMHR